MVGAASATLRIAADLYNVRAMPFDGLRVLALETRRAEEMATLIRKQGGDAFVAPSMKEAPLENNEEAFAAAERLYRGEFDMMIFLTGVGTRALHRLLATRYPGARFPEELRKLTVVARGPKPLAALKELNVPVHVRVPEPNTWREVMEAIRDRPEKRVAVQEYGRSNPELIQALRARGAEVTAIRIYQWDLPENTGPLRQAARELAENGFDIVMFTTPAQVMHLFRMAEDEQVVEGMKESFSRAVVASIGPATTEMLAAYGVIADLEPGHPKMGYLVKETAEQAPKLLAKKRSGKALR